MAQDALATFADETTSGKWQELLLADALFADGRFTDAFAAYRQALAALPAMVSIHDSVARIYEQTGHADWAAVERTRGRLTVAQCVKRKALCEFRAGRYRAALAAARSGVDAGVALLAGARGNRADEGGVQPSRPAAGFPRAARAARRAGDRRPAVMPTRSRS